MLKLLVKKQLFEIFRSYFYDAKKNKARTKGATIGYIVMFVLLMVCLLGTMFGVLSNTMCGPLAEMGMDWLYFVIMGMMAVFLGAFGSVFNTYSGLYLAKDNDLLLSMPHSRAGHHDLPAAERLSHGPDVLRHRDPAGHHCLLVHRPYHGGPYSGRRGAAGGHLPVRADAVLRTGLGGGQDQPEAEA